MSIFMMYRYHCIRSLYAFLCRALFSTCRNGICC